MPFDGVRLEREGSLLAGAHRFGKIDGVGEVGEPFLVVVGGKLAGKPVGGELADGGVEGALDVSDIRALCDGGDVSCHHGEHLVCRKNRPK